MQSAAEQGEWAHYVMEVLHALWDGRAESLLPRLASGFHWIGLDMASRLRGVSDFPVALECFRSLHPHADIVDEQYREVLAEEGMHVVAGRVEISPLTDQDDPIGSQAVLHMTLSMRETSSGYELFLAHLGIATHAAMRASG